MSTARDDILGRIRRANSGISVPVDIPREYDRTGAEPPGSAAVLDLLEDRLVDYRAVVHRADHIPGAIRDALGSAGAVVVPPGLDPAWVTDAVIDDGALTARELDRFDAVVTAATVACARTGTIVLDSSPDQGRRMLSLVPDHHVCVVRAEQVVESVPEMLARLRPDRPLTFVSGPSATSDIELKRVEGVHGPRQLHVVLAAPQR